MIVGRLRAFAQAPQQSQELRARRIKERIEKIRLIGASERGDPIYLELHKLALVFLSDGPNEN